MEEDTRMKSPYSAEFLASFKEMVYNWAIKLSDLNNYHHHGQGD